ncbi:phosphotransferase [Microaerobacter geothermalis]|uniref:phosphotransferase n=1 Tax=Microaerobacter geothermalis TaxID=674972 RepID=UPI001F33FB40|nr:phosphotransferase [Microaerobacter geothermalis]MCF6092728.1 phosphotransferase [Microaerobacter geothermalis]
MDILFQKASHFLGEKIYLWKKWGNLWYIGASHGAYMMKSYPSDKDLDWLHSLSTQVINNQFTNVCSFRVKNGVPFFEHQGHWFMVMPYIPGRQMTYQKITDAQQAAVSLAQFHQAAQRIKGGKEITGIPLYEKWMQRVKNFERSLEKIGLNYPKSPLELWMIQNGARILKEAYHALEELPMSLLKELTFKDAAKSAVAHRDVASHNFLKTAEGEVYIIDLDTAGIDLQLGDLVQLINRVMVEQNWNDYFLADIVNRYQDYIPLEERELVLLSFLLRFPSDIMREINGVLFKKKGYRQNRVFHFIKRYEGQWNKRKEVIRSYLKLFPVLHYSSYVNIYDKA